MSLTVENLSCRRDGRLVFSGVSFTLAPGEVRLLRGPNGVGKSSLLRTLAGLVPAAGGTISLDGASPRSMDAWTERVAYAGHLDAIKPQLSVGENLRFWAALHGARSIEPALDAFDLAALRHRAAHACSAGQQRRLGLARLILAPRRLWLLDEPTVALDAGSVTRFNSALAAHAVAGGMALVATHIELGCENAAPLTLSPPDIETPAADDPFLQGSFA